MADPLSISASIAGILTLSGKIIHSTYKYGADVKGAPEEIRNFLSEMTINTGLLHALKSLIDSHAQSGSPTTGEHQTISTICGKNGALESFRKTLNKVNDMLDKHENTPSPNKRQKMNRLTGRLKWPFEKVETQEMVQQLEKLKAAFTLALSIDDSNLLNNLRQDIASIASAHSKQVELMEEQRQSDKLMGLMKWLSPVDMEAHHGSVSVLQQPHTSRWFTEGEELRAWAGGGHKLLWIHGKPGSGKTVLFSSTVNKLRQERDVSTGLAFFYCDYRDPRLRSPSMILGGLLKSLATQNKDVAAALGKLFDAQRQQNQHADQLSVETLQKQLVSASSCFGMVLILIDALDEAIGREALLPFLHELVAPQSSRFKFLLTSRREADLEAVFARCPTVCLNEETNSGDIHLYVSAQIEQRIQRGVFHLNDSFLKETIISQLVGHAGGLFQWAKYQLDNLFLLRTDEEQQAFLETIETQLDKVYERTLLHFNTISDTDHKLIKSVLQGLVGFLKPPNREEVIQVIKKDDHAPDTISLREKLSDGSIRKLFRGLVEINGETKAYQFSHYSVREFLTSHRLDATALTEYRVCEAQAHRKLALHCLHALNEGEVSPLYGYAASQWMEHVKRAPEDSELDDNLVEFLSLGQLNEWADSTPFAEWLSHCESKKPVPAKIHDRSMAFREALNLGRDSVTLRLIGHGIHRIQHPHGYNVPIVDAVLLGASRCVILELLKSGVEVDQLRFGDQTALSIAVTRDDKDLVTLLLSHGADMHRILDKDYHVTGSALNQAVLYGSKDMVSFLLENGAEKNRRVSHVGTPVQAAVSESRLEILKLLLSHGANVCASEGDYGTALHGAIRPGIDSEDMVRLLLDHGARRVIDELASAEGSALYEAVATNSSTRLVELLLENGADPNLEAAPFTNPLHRAILNQNVAAFNILLENGSTGRSFFGPFRSALECAAFAGHEGIFRKLLQVQSAEFQDPVITSRTLQQAIVRGNFNILAQAVQTCEDSRAKDEHGWTAYMCGLHVRCTQSLKLLPIGLGNMDPASVAMTASTPTHWDVERLSPSRRSLVRQENSKLQYSGVHDPCRGLKSSEPVGIFANHPFPPCQSFYLEITIAQFWSSSSINFGLEGTVEGASHMIHLGGTYLFVLSGGEPLPRVHTGDTIGCGLDWDRSEVYFTVNGQRLDQITKSVRRAKYFPKILFDQDDAILIAKFGAH
ncbi:hypothetical protein ACJZ2D_016721 [Fusarium nematophilum]